MINFSLNSFLCLLNEEVCEPESTPAEDNLSMPHLSVREACKIKLSAQPNKNRQKHHEPKNIQIL